MKTRCMTWAVLGVLACGPALAWGLADPPMDKPNWWVHPPDSLTRLQYHSFITDPVANLAPDYTENGYAPSVADAWIYPAGELGWSITTGPADPTWGDAKGIRLQPNDVFTKVMGNWAVPEYRKEYFVEIVWAPADMQFDGVWPTLNVTAPNGYTVTPDSVLFVGPDANGWYIQKWSGFITPQPDQEAFAFSFPETVYLDSAWIGTNCPEPASLALLGLAGAALLGRRRR